MQTNKTGEKNSNLEKATRKMREEEEQQKDDNGTIPPTAGQSLTRYLEKHFGKIKRTKKICQKAKTV